MSSRATEIVSFDSAFRLEGVEGDLHRLSQTQLKEEKWTYAHPTLEASKVERNFTPDCEVFKDSFYDAFPALIGLDMNNVFIAGGAVTSILTYHKTGGDVDIFIYGLSEEKATEKMEYILKHITKTLFYGDTHTHTRKSVFRALKKLNDPATDPETKKHCKFILEHNQKGLRFFKKPEKQWTAEEKELSMNLMLTRTSGAITIDRKYQIILRLYKTKSEILHGFDFGSCAVGFDGNEVYFTSLAKFALEHGYNIVDPSRRSTTYETRLWKYYFRGYGIIFPDMKGLENGEKPIDLPYMAFTAKVEGNKIEWPRKVQKDVIKSDYDEDTNFYTALNRKIRFLLDQPKVGEPKKEEDTLKGGELQTPGEVVEAKKEEANLPVEEVKTRVPMFSYIAHTVKDLLEAPVFIEVESLLKHFKRMRALMTSNKAPLMYFKEVVCEDLGRLFTSTPKELDALFTDRLKLIYSRAREMKAGPITWVTKNPGRQWTSSFNPVLSDPKDWYGKMYKGGSPRSEAKE